jgi:hypothetical protein
MSLATVADLAAYLQREFSFAEEASAQLALDVASAVVVERAGQQFELVHDDQVTLDTFHGEDIRLPQRPVLSVSSVTTRDRGSTVSTTRTAGADFEVRGDRLRWVGLGRWPYEVTVTYTHGYAFIPDEVRGATLAVAAEMLVNPEGLSRSAVDDANDQHEWADDSPAERLLKLVARKYGRRPLVVNLR